jgi:hypothetical protein
MVIASVGEPQTKHREHTDLSDDRSAVYEEWIYGQPPQPTQFVRFRSGRVIRLEIAAIGKPIEVHDKNEIGGAPEPALLARTIANGDAQPNPDGDHGATKPPTLMLPGEASDAPATSGKVNLPANTSPKQLASASPHE